MSPWPGGSFDTVSLKAEIEQLDKRLSDPAVWSASGDGEVLSRRRASVLGGLERSAAFARAVDEVETLAEWIREGEDVIEDFREHLDRLEGQLDEFDLQRLFAGEHDSENAIVTINPGAGGTDAQDWAEMLLGMYIRWAKGRGFDIKLLDRQPAEEAGIKGATFEVRGDHAYGRLRVESGIHRLVRMSPFDAQHRRHTSFASVAAFPDLDNRIEIDVDENDLRIDTFRASGKGGQHVNVTDSAVRITHLPTGLVVSCQNERSQHRNRDSAMKVLRVRLYDRAVRERKAQEEAQKEGLGENTWGNQIRSYVFQPYRMVKDHRTNHQVGDVDRVMNGDLDGFIKAGLNLSARSTSSGSGSAAGRATERGKAG